MEQYIHIFYFSCIKKKIYHEIYLVTKTDGLFSLKTVKTVFIFNDT